MNAVFVVNLCGTCTYKVNKRVALTGLTIFNWSRVRLTLGATIMYALIAQW